MCNEYVLQSTNLLLDSATNKFQILNNLLAKPRKTCSKDVPNFCKIYWGPENIVFYTGADEDSGIEYEANYSDTETN